MLRPMAFGLVAFIAFAPLQSQAFPNAGAPLPRGDANLVEVAVHCGPHAHYVRGHRDKNHHYVKGRCVRDKRR